MNNTIPFNFNITDDELKEACSSECVKQFFERGFANELWATSKADIVDAVCNAIAHTTYIQAIAIDEISKKLESTRFRTDVIETAAEKMVSSEVKELISSDEFMDHLSKKVAASIMRRQRKSKVKELLEKMNALIEELDKQDQEERI